MYMWTIYRPKCTVRMCAYSVLRLIFDVELILFAVKKKQKNSRGNEMLTDCRQPFWHDFKTRHYI